MNLRRTLQHNSSETKCIRNANIPEKIQEFDRVWSVSQCKAIYSALHRFGWVEVSRVHKVHLRRGRRIPVNALSAGRRCKSASRGKVGVLLFIQGTQFLAVQYPTASKLLERARLHSLKDSIQQGTQNGGKW